MSTETDRDSFGAEGEHGPLAGSVQARGSPGGPAPGSREAFLARPLPSELSRRLAATLGLGRRPASFGDLVSGLRARGPFASPEALERLCTAESRHEVRFGDGEVRHTHCVLDALVLACRSGTTTDVVSRDPLGGTVRVRVEHGRFAWDPPGAVVSFGVGPGASEDPREALCPYLNAFPTQADYLRWSSELAGAATVSLPVADALALASELARA
jgi:alkylmercury lyase